MKDRKATSIDIAYRAGVSQATVSRALRNSPLVTQDTKDKIHAIARELNYRVDKHAASLRSQSSKTLALLLFADCTTDSTQINPFFITLLSSITRAAADRGYDLLLSFQHPEEDWHIEYEVSSRADGIMLLGYGDYTSYREKLERLEQAGAHFIVWGATEAHHPGHTIGCDNAAGGYLATKHLLELGHRAIAFIGGATERSPEFMMRHRGYLTALAEANVDVNPALQSDVYNFDDDGYRAAKNLITSGAQFTAIQCASDLIALGALKALREAGLRVPEDLSLVGFDDIPAASYMDPPLTTVNQDTAHASELMVDTLIAMIDGEATESTLVTPRLVVRGSTAQR